MVQNAGAGGHSSRPKPQMISSLPLITPRFGIGIFHFFCMSIVRRYRIFIAACLLGKAPFPSVTLRN